MNTFPARNLPGAAENWGRAVESEVASLQSGISRVRGAWSNGERATSGQLSNAAIRIVTLSERSIQDVPLTPVSVTGNATSEAFPRDETIATFSAPEFPNPALLTFSGEVSASANPLNAIAALEFRYLGSVFMRLTGRPGDQLGDQDSVTLTGFSRIPVTPGVSPEISVTLIRQGTTSGASTLTLRNARIALEYSGVTP